jgi:N-acetylgalactosamine-6-sulfatase
MKTSAFGLLLLASCAAASGPSPSRPNVLLLLADDLGYGDLGCFGAPDVRTPAIDALAAQGVRFTQFYSNGPECTPTRTALLTGRYQHRVGGLECAIGLAGVGRYDDAERLAARRELGLPVEETSLARMLKDAGYETAIVGKWHLGYERKFLPDRHGFDYSLGPLGGAVDYFHHCEPDGTNMLYENGGPVRREGYLTDLLAETAARFIRRPRPKPFFLYVPFNAPHSPYQGPDDRREKPLSQAEWSQGTRAKFAEMVERMDRGVGEILRALDESGQAERTLVVFTSDNGGDPRGRNLPLSGRKGGLYEGGIRVPCIARWPRVLGTGVSQRVGITMDLTRSILRAAGAAPARPLDGTDLLRAVVAGGEPAPRTLFWRARRGAETWKAIREGNLKYLFRQDGKGREEHLFDLESDPAEKSDLVAGRPADRDRLVGLLASWEREVRPAR